MTFPSSKDRPTARPLSLVSFGIPHTQLWVFPPLASNEARRQRPDYLHWPRSVSSGRLPRHSRTGSHWHGEREKEGGRKTDPGSSQSALLGRLMNVQDFTIFATQASGVRLQWVTVSRLENPPARHRRPPPSQPTSPTVPPEPELASLPPSTNTGGLSLTAPRRTPTTTSLALSTLGHDCTDSNRQHTLTGPTASWHGSPPPPRAAYVRLLQHWCIHEPDTWLFEDRRWSSSDSFPATRTTKRIFCLPEDDERSH